MQDFFPLPAFEIWFSFVSLYTWKIQIKPSNFVKWGFVWKEGLSIFKDMKKNILWLLVIHGSIAIFSVLSLWTSKFLLGEADSGKIVHFQLFLISWKLWCGLFPPALQNGEEGRCLIYFLCSFLAGRAGISLAPLFFHQPFLRDQRCDILCLKVNETLIN